MTPTFRKGRTIHMNRHHIKRKRRKVKRRRVFWLLVFPLLLLALSATGYGAYLYKKAESIANGSYKELDGREKSNLRDEVVDPSEDNISILFIGIDDSESRNFGTATRSDALMLATFNKKENSVKLLSIPRDSYVYIPEVGYSTRINHAHAFGGPKATIETVENLLDVPVDYYVRMNFYAFIDVVDALGGIEVNVPYEIYEKDTEDNRNAIHLLPGEQKLNGEEALALARTRKKDNDIERGKRQQEIMKAILKKAISVNAITKYTDVMEAIGDNMETNMKFSEMRALLSYGIKNQLTIDSLTLEGSDGYQSGIGYIYELDEEDLESVKTTLKKHLDVSSREDTDEKEVAQQ
jgi:polyisoprenyl-teichoic acid--peptidoglycan teichoic acid transferase